MEYRGIMLTKSQALLALTSYLFEQTALRQPKTRIMRLHQRLLAKTYQLMRTFFDPVVRVNIRGRSLYMNSSHALPRHVAHWAHYDTALPRLCAFLNSRDGHLTLIDVGANIGDSVSLVAAITPGTFLCIEPDERYLTFLRLNVKDIGNVEIENVVVSDVEAELPIKLLHDHGTSSISSVDHGAHSIPTSTIDKLVEKHRAFATTNIMKIDTDGYDYKVLRGSGALIREARPALYFELSPQHLKSVGGEDPMSIFDYLFRNGYSNALFYDHIGLPLMRLKTNDTNAISMLLDYAEIRAGFYYDVLLFHDSKETDFAEFYRDEVQRFHPERFAGSASLKPSLPTRSH